MLRIPLPEDDGFALAKRAHPLQLRGKSRVGGSASRRHTRGVECVASHSSRPSCATGQDLRYCVKTREESYTGSPAAQPLTQNLEPRTLNRPSGLFVVANTSCQFVMLSYACAYEKLRYEKFRKF